MRIQKFEGVNQGRILMGMITHDGILTKIAQQVKDDRSPFREKWLDLIARWCLDHHKRYGKAPRKAILSHFAEYSESSKDTDTVDLVEKFLGQMSRDYSGLKHELDEGVISDLAARHFEKVRLLHLAESIQAEVERGNIEEAKVLQQSFRRIDTDVHLKEDPLTKEAILETFRKVQETDVLVQFPGDMDRFLSPFFIRTGFISFVGPEKRGKSYWLNEVVWQALRQRRKVLYYVFGDLSRAEVYQRLYSRATKRPWKSQEVEIPTGIKVNPDKRTFRKRKKTVNLKRVSPKMVWKARKKLLSITASGQVGLKVAVCGGYTLSASDIERDVRDLSDREGWSPDLVVIDYADLLKPEVDVRQQDVRHQINLTWVVLRRIALERHCLVVTATQGAASSYKDKWVMRKDDFSEDKRKNAHVTGMLGINQSEEEKEHGVYRLNWIVLRGGKWSESQVVWTAGNLAIACPCLVSSL